MRRVLLTVAYDGTDFHGFARQEGVRTVEGALADAVYEITKERVEITGASRTDAGVHAYGNLAVFDTETEIPADRFPYALNTVLSEDVRVVHAKETDEAFHPRRTGWEKTYEYRILNTPWGDPTLRRYTYHYRTPLDAAAMKEAAAALVGEHDFTSFCSVHSQSETRIRTITACRVLTRDACPGALPGAIQNGTVPAEADAAAEALQGGSLLVIRVTGNGFLYHMVRIIAGTLLDAGRGRLAPADIPAILEARNRSRAGTTLPPEGLFLLGYDRKKNQEQNQGGTTCTTDI